MANELRIDTSLIDYTGIKHSKRTRLQTPAAIIVIPEDNKGITFLWDAIGDGAHFSNSWELEDNSGDVVATSASRGSLASARLRVGASGTAGVDPSQPTTPNVFRHLLDEIDFATGKIHLTAGGNAIPPSFGLMRTNNFDALQDAYTDGGRIAVTIPFTVVAV